MKQTNAQGGNGKIHTISQALELLNSVAEDRSTEIRGMLTNDYQDLKRVLSDAKPEVKSALNGVKQAAVESAVSARDKAVAAAKDTAERADQSVHDNAWKFIGLASAMSLLAGLFMGRRSVRKND